MYRAVTKSSEIECVTYETTGSGIKLYNEAEQIIAYIPNSSLEVLLNADVYEEEHDERAMR